MSVIRGKISMHLDPNGVRLLTQYAHGRVALSTPRNLYNLYDVIYIKAAKYKITQNATSLWNESLDDNVPERARESRIELKRDVGPYTAYPKLLAFLAVVCISVKGNVVPFENLKTPPG